MIKMKSFSVSVVFFLNDAKFSRYKIFCCLHHTGCKIRCGEFYLTYAGGQGRGQGTLYNNWRRFLRQDGPTISSGWTKDRQDGPSGWTKDRQSLG
jgi:hypothetical protein